MKWALGTWIHGSFFVALLLLFCCCCCCRYNCCCSYFNWKTNLLIQKKCISQWETFFVWFHQKWNNSQWKKMKQATKKRNDENVEFTFDTNKSHSQWSFRAVETTNPNRNGAIGIRFGEYMLHQKERPHFDHCHPKIASIAFTFQNGKRFGMLSLRMLNILKKRRHFILIRQAVEPILAYELRKKAVNYIIIVA